MADALEELNIVEEEKDNEVKARSRQRLQHVELWTLRNKTSSETVSMPLFWSLVVFDMLRDASFAQTSLRASNDEYSLL